MKTVSECRKELKKIEKELEELREGIKTLTGVREGILFVLSTSKEKKDAVLRSKS